MRCNIEESSSTWTPSSIIARLGKEINDKDFMCYWEQENSIPIFCPALTDGFIGDTLLQSHHGALNRPKLLNRIPPPD